MKRINELCGNAWETAIKNVIAKINTAGIKCGVIYTFNQDAAFIEDLANILEVKFDDNGNII